MKSPSRAQNRFANNTFYCVCVCVFFMVAGSLVLFYASSFELPFDRLRHVRFFCYARSFGIYTFMFEHKRI